MQAAVIASPHHAKYAEAIDRESAREKLAVKLEQGAAKKAEEEAAAAAQKEAEKEAKAEAKERSSSSRKPTKQEEGGLVRDVVESGAFKDFMRTAAREIARGMFKTGRR
jgi:FKBP-type peptidyl-prolyl cis-trans isomerase